MLKEIEAVEYAFKDLGEVIGVDFAKKSKELLLGSQRFYR